MLQSTLEVADAAPAESGALSELRLSQAARQAVLTKEFGKTRSGHWLSRILRTLGRHHETWAGNAWQTCA
jgi:hypothetical protein